MATTPDPADLTQDVADLRAALQEASRHLAFAAGQMARDDATRATEMMAVTKRSEAVLHRTATVTNSTDARQL